MEIEPLEDIVTGLEPKPLTYRKECCKADREGWEENVERHHECKLDS
jgi:hypothetical protein